ncbi:hypothetical protein Sango_1680800 [Sesamum angolense]|uniref:Retrotransposon gag domain-containing protein n=1 Tax=Sesamum angolense TaxID=2727404 RepID=A0AAE1WL29_9LAMI|nr:hypothetical protein Sango_1680800 [Sesamum angolense]
MAEDTSTLRDLAVPSALSLHSSISGPLIELDDLELKLALISIVQHNQFGGLPTENPNLHLSIFLDCFEVLNLSRVSSDAIKLKLFPFSLKDDARAWLHSLPVGSITTWEQLSEAFLAKYYPPSRKAQLSKQILCFVQKEDESLYDAWERFNKLLRLCPNHGFEKWLILHTFYDGLTYYTRMMVNAASGGAFMNKTVSDGYSLIEVMAENQYQWSNERVEPKMSPSRSNVDSLTLLADTVDALAQKVYQLDMNASSPQDSVFASERGRRSQPSGRSADYDKLHASISFTEVELLSQRALLRSMQTMIRTIYDWHLQQGHFLHLPQ